MTTLRRPSVYLVTDRRQLAPDARTVRDELRALEALLDEAIESDVDAIQVREGDLNAGELTAFVTRVAARAHQGGARVLVNDRPDVALVADADGVHLRGDGPALARVRSLRPDWVLGRSVHSGDACETHGAADYLLFGTVFPSASKPSERVVAGIDALSAAVSRSAGPVLAIGGITPARVPACMSAGAAGVAAIGVFLPPGRSRDGLGARRAVHELRAALATGGHR